MRAEQDKCLLLYNKCPSHEYALVTFRYNYTYLVVSLVAAPVPDAPPATTPAPAPYENRLIRYLRTAFLALEQARNRTFDDEDYEDGWDKCERFEQPVNKAVIRLAGALFDQKAPPPRKRPKGLSLQDLVWHPEIHFRLQTVDGAVKIFEIPATQAVCAPKPVTLPRPDPTFSPDPRFPTYSAADLRVCNEFSSGDGPVCKVRLADGQLMMSKTPQRGLQSEETQREMNMLVRIHDAEAKLGIRIATPHLVGYVTHAETGVVIGFVREWVAASRHGATLRQIPMAKMSLDQRQKWADQIEDTMEDLHNADLFWGDCKPANIIVDREQNIWLIDLGGNFSQHWVDKELSGTLAGDEQGLLNLQKFLGVIEDDRKHKGV
ncbi:Protein kinase-like domain [Cordyceps militaris CM01]|uniref:Protein kinase-like domain n=1 Tax=Cordyceps militaris (strain CM01) TaxID=983644 RepID=G3JUU9_CORMM|nr:Protein kinase-like domain [Cordyceps militaris CM01]EGX87629.1 Protein kinase-like domain [Cordyceps militaris CM01]